MRRHKKTKRNPRGAGRPPFVPDGLSCVIRVRTSEAEAAALTEQARREGITYRGGGSPGVILRRAAHAYMHSPELRDAINRYYAEHPPTA